MDRLRRVLCSRSTRVTSRHLRAERPLHRRRRGACLYLRHRHQRQRRGTRRPIRVVPPGALGAPVKISLPTGTSRRPGRKARGGRI